jgi:hypothetical protein
MHSNKVRWELDAKVVLQFVALDLRLLGTFLVGCEKCREARVPQFDILIIAYVYIDALNNNINK